MKGGVGKTTLAVNLADFLQNRYKKRVLLVDVDPQFNATQCLVSGKSYIEYLNSGGSTIVDVFNSTAKATSSVVNGNNIDKPITYDSIKPFKTRRDFDIIPGQLDLFRYEMAPGQGKEMRLKNYLQSINTEYDICIIDSPPTPSVWMSSALIASDFYLIPVKPDPISITGIDLLEGIISEKSENYGCKCNCCGIVFTMVERHTKVFKDANEYFRGNKKWKSYVYGKVVLKRTDIPKGQLSNIFIIDIDDTDLKTEFAGIVQEFIRRVEA
jgi:chromosome partitioning protein